MAIPGFEIPVASTSAFGDVVESDCLKLMKKLSDDSVPLIIADPPYGIAYHSGHYKRKNPHSPVSGDWNFQIGPFLHECGRVLQDGGALYLFCRWDVLPLWLPSIPTVMKVKTVIAWTKDNWSAGDLEGSFGNQYEQIIFAAKGRHLLRGKRWSNVWPFPRVPVGKMLHPTQKPVELLERAILCSSDEGNFIVDPFCGSGTTGVASARTKRRYLLGDIDGKMVKLSRKRLGLSSVQGIAEEETEPIYNMEFTDPFQLGVEPDGLRMIWNVLNENVKKL